MFGGRGPREHRCQPRRLGRHALSQARLGEHPVECLADSRAVVRRNQQARTAGEQLDGVWKGGRHDGLPAAMASTSTPEVIWSRESYGSRTRRPGGSAGSGRLVEVRARIATDGCTPTTRARWASLSGRSRHAGATRGCVWPATMYAGSGCSYRRRCRPSMAHSMPLPGPSSPQVRMRGRRGGIDGQHRCVRGGVQRRPWRITCTLAGSAP